VCSVVAASTFLGWALVANAPVPKGARVFASAHRSMSALALPPASRVAGRCFPFRQFGVSETDAPLGCGVVFLFSGFLFGHAESLNIFHLWIHFLF
jgi:hypothetical protein